jgi:transglutaminase-like putative cysteine protease
MKSMFYQVRHTTTYLYSDAVVLCQNQARLSPQTTRGQTRHSYSLEIIPEPSVRRRWSDAFQNEVWYFSIEVPHHRLQVTSRSLVERLSTEPVNANSTPPWERVRDLLARPEGVAERMAGQFRVESPFIMELPEARDYALQSFLPGRPILEAALDLTRRIHADFHYSPATTAISTPTREVFLSRRGVCQDFAHLQITCLRSLGLSARYVSGYLVTLPPPGKPRLVGADASHAWLAVFVPEAGWIDLDPTNNLIPADRHVTIGWGRDYGDVCPIKGVFTGGGGQSIAVAVDVEPVEMSFLSTDLSDDVTVIPE